MEKKKIVISTSSFGEFDGDSVDILKNEGLEVILNPYHRKVTGQELIQLSKDAIGLIAGTESIDKFVLENLPILKVISRCGVGLDNIDMESASRLGIKVFNTPDAPTLAVVELTLGLVLNLLRKINEGDYLIKRGEWKKPMGSLLQGKNIGILGFGRIGKKIGEIFSGLGCHVAYSDPFVEDKTLGFMRKTKEELLAWSDIVTIHASTTSLLIEDEDLCLMKKGSWLVNVSRGSAIDEVALSKHLKNGHLAGAALDVFSKEPYSGCLINLDNVILTPHIGSYAREARIRMEIQAAKNLIEGLKEDKK